MNFTRESVASVAVLPRGGLCYDGWWAGRRLERRTLCRTRTLPRQNPALVMPWRSQDAATISDEGTSDAER